MLIKGLFWHPVIPDLAGNPATGCSYDGCFLKMKEKNLKNIGRLSSQRSTGYDLIRKLHFVFL